MLKYWLALAALVAAAFGLSAPLVAAPMTPADFAAPRLWSYPVISPDGSRIALIMH